MLFFCSIISFLGQKVEKNSSLVCGIDPGLASGGLVVIDALDGDRVIAAYSLVEKKGDSKEARARAEEMAASLGGWGDKAFTSAALRSTSWIAKAEEALSEITKKHGIVAWCAVESFVDQPSRARKEKEGLLRNRWQTPLSMGALALVLSSFGLSLERGNLVYQNAGVVLPQWRDELALLESKKEVVAGDKIVKNDHQRKALLHALALSLRLRHEGKLSQGRPGSSAG